MKVAYVGYNSGGFSSSNEPAFPPNTRTTTYCHSETGEKITGIHGVSGKGVGVSGNTLYFVNPWITGNILNLGSGSVNDDNRTTGDITGAYTQLYIYVIIVNTGQTSYVPSAGSIDLAWYSSDHLNGLLIGIYYQGTFYPTSSAPTITPSTSYYAIYEITIHYISNPPSSYSNYNSVMFWGDASVTDASGSNAENQNYYSGTVLVSGLWIRASC
jgi:hypothetical protein